MAVMRNLLGLYIANVRLVVVVNLPTKTAPVTSVAYYKGISEIVDCE